MSDKTQQNEADEANTDNILQDAPGSDTVEEDNTSKEDVSEELATPEVPFDVASISHEAESTGEEAKAADTAPEASEAAEADETIEADTPTMAIEDDAPSGPSEPELTHAHFKPIPAEKLKRAKRIRRILVAIIIVLILLLVGSGVAAVYYYFTYHAPPTHSIDQPTVVIDNDEEVNDRGTTETIDMPNLTQLFGKTPEEAKSLLGEDYSITKTDTSEETPAEGEEGAEGSEGAEATNPDTAIKQVVTISYTPSTETSSVGGAQVQNIYLSLNEAGVTVELYFVSSLSLLDIPFSSFAGLIESKDAIADTLELAGATLSPDYAYTAPTAEEYIEYVDAEASVKKVRKESATIKGTLVAAQPPTNFELTYTYDYGATGVEETPDRQATQRMIYIKLS